MGRFGVGYGSNDRDKIILLVAVIIVVLLILAALGLANTDKNRIDNRCNSISPCPIQFDSVTFNDGTASLLVNTMTMTTILNEFLVITVEISSAAEPTVTITDSQSNTFTKIIDNCCTPSTTVGIQIWVTKTSAASSDVVTVTRSDATGDMLLIMTSYKNVLGVGTSNSTSGTSVTSGSILLTTTQPGSWIVGGTSVGVSLVNGIVAGPNLVQRKTSTVPFTTGDLEDSNSSLINNFKFTYSSSWASLGTLDFAMSAIELTPVFPFPPDEIGECSTTNGRCLTVQYAINEVFKTSGINALANIVVGTSYCTGVTTSALTTSKTDFIQMMSTYSGQSRNDTGAIVEVQMFISSNAPSTTFGAGVCAAGGTLVSHGKLVFTTSGVTLTAFGLNEYPTSMSGAMSEVSGTYYGWLLIIPQSVGAGNLGSTIQYAQWATTGHTSIEMQEIK